jgi:hypothetical protein
MTLRSNRTLDDGEYMTPARGLGVLRDAAVTTGTDFTLTEWAGQIINVDVSGDAEACFFEATGQSITTTTVTTAPASGSEAAIRTNAFVIRSGMRNEFVVPTSDLATPVVVLRIAAASGTITVRIDRASSVG